MPKKYDFSGWATRNDLLCSDGRTIKRDAFKHQDGLTVPLVWQHQHSGPENILGYAVLENADGGVLAHGVFNGSESGQNAKILVEHGDITALSIFANHLRQSGGDVLHGDIKEVSLVLSGANPGASILFPTLEHGDGDPDEAIIFTGEDLFMAHADTKDDGDEEDEKKSKEDDGEDDDETVEDVMNTLSPKQEKVVMYLLNEAAKSGEASHSDEDYDYADYSEGGTEMKHNVFEGAGAANQTFLSHDDFKTIMKDAKALGSLREAIHQHQEDGVLSHIDVPSGMTGPSSATSSQTYGFRDPDMLFPEFRSMTTQPEWIKRETDWVDEFLNAVHRTPFSRIKSVFADITEDEARARGYIKGKLKKEEVFTLLKRTTEPQTIYKKQKMDRDDIVDITDFDVIAWIRGEMRIMLNEEIARACLIGDGRSSSSDDKIKEDHIRPIVSDSALFTVPVEVDSSDLANNFIDEAIRARKFYKGSGTPNLYTTADMHTEMLLLKDEMGHRLYKTDAELATALRVNKIIEVEPMEGFKIGTADLYGIIVNPIDYNIGADKGGEISMFDDFDIDYNQYKYLLETRISGALTKPYSALVLKKKAATSGSGD